MSWPRLTEERGLFDPHPRRCQLCGGDQELDLWQEHDERDKPEGRAIILCESCSKRVIDKHPRLYARRGIFVPWPGAMALCVDCKHRRGVTCPLTKASGGPGIEIKYPQPFKAMVDGTRGGRRVGWMQTLYNGDPTSCSGRSA
jgi:hypothetical protein